MPYRQSEKDGDRSSRAQRGSFAWLRTIFLEDWNLKILALAITLGLWFAVTGQRTPATIRLSDVQLSFRLPNDMEVGNDPRDKVDVVLTGSKPSLDRINARNLIAFVDVSGFQQGKHTIRLTREMVNMDLPEGVRIDSLDPNTVALRLEARAEREVPIEVKTQGKLPNGVELRAITITPPMVKVRGPASHVNLLEKVFTESISLDGLSSSSEITQTAIDVADDKITISDPVVNVFLDIGEERIERTFDQIAVRESSGAIVRPQVANVTIFGARSTVEHLRAMDLSILLNVSEDGSITPTLVVPPGLEGKVELRSTRPTGFTISK